MLYAGTSEVCITPETGLPIAGYFAPRVSTGVHDDLFVRALVMECGRESICLISCDLLSIKSSTVEEARRLIEERCGIPGRNVMICCSHTHTGPYTSRVFGWGLERKYIETLTQKIAEAAFVAWEGRTRALVGIGTGRVEGIAFNRRYHMRGGSVRTNPGIGNPDIVSPAGPLDETLGVIKVQDPAGHLKAAWLNYAVHGDVVTGCEFSADYAGYLSQALKEEYKDASVLFSNGACGDVNHLDVFGPADQNGFGHARMMGRSIAAEAVKVLDRTAVEPEVKLACAVEETIIPTRQVPPDDLKAARSLLAQKFESGERAATSEDLGSLAAETAYAGELVELAEEGEETARVVVQAIRIGSSVIIALPAEVFTEIGLAAKRHSPFAPTFISCYANGMAGYIPTEKAFTEGGYETRLARTSKLVPSAEKMVLQAVDRIIEKIVRL